MKWKRFRGKVDVLSLIGVGFMVVSLFAITTVAANPIKKQLTGALARYSADALIRQRERTGECKGKYCLAEEVIRNKENQGSNSNAANSAQTAAEQEIIDTYNKALAGDTNALETLRENNSTLSKQVEEILKSQQEPEQQTEQQPAQQQTTTGPTSLTELTGTVGTTTQVENVSTTDKITTVYLTRPDGIYKIEETVTRNTDTGEIISKKLSEPIFVSPVKEGVTIEPSVEEITGTTGSQETSPNLLLIIARKLNINLEGLTGISQNSTTIQDDRTSNLDSQTIAGSSGTLSQSLTTLKSDSSSLTNLIGQTGSIPNETGLNSAGDATQVLIKSPEISLSSGINSTVGQIPQGPTLVNIETRDIDPFGNIKQTAGKIDPSIGSSLLSSKGSSGSISQSSDLKSGINSKEGKSKLSTDSDFAETFGKFIAQIPIVGGIYKAPSAAGVVKTWLNDIRNIIASGLSAITGQKPISMTTNPALDPANIKTNDNLVTSVPLFNGNAVYAEYVSPDARNITYHVIRVDHTHAQFFVTPLQKRTTTSNFLEVNNLDIAINGDGFNRFTDQLAGFAASSGQAYGTKNTEQTIYFDKNNNISFTPPPSGEIWNAISFPNMIVQNGKPVPHPEKVEIYPRTALGITKDNNLILVAVDGVEYESGMYLPELTQILIEQGAVTAVMFDSGSSTTMVIKGPDGKPKVINNPDGGESQVLNQLGIRFTP